MSDVARRISRAALALVGGAPGISAFAAGHPVLGGVLIVVGEAVTAVGVFAGRMADDVSTKLWDRRRDAVVDWFDKQLFGGGRSFDRAYRKSVLDEVTYMDPKGLSTQPPITPKLGDLYIDLHLSPHPLHKLNRGLLTEPPSGNARQETIWSFLDPTESHVLVGQPHIGDLGWSEVSTAPG